MIRDNLVLIGFMGSGKTVIGRAVARLLDYEFVDTDEQIQQVTGMTLNALFKKHGEIRFRSEEDLVVKKLALRKRLVIASGGSLMPEKEPLTLLREQSWFVLLQAAPDVILERLSRKTNRGNRPLISGKPSIEQVRQLLEERQQQYQELANFTVNTSDIGVEEAAALIVKSYRQAGK